MVNLDTLFEVCWYPIFHYVLLFGAVYKLYDFPEESSAEVSRTQTRHLQTSYKIQAKQTKEQRPHLENIYRHEATYVFLVCVTLDL